MLKLFLVIDPFDNLVKAINTYSRHAEIYTYMHIQNTSMSWFINLLSF